MRGPSAMRATLAALGLSFLLGLTGSEAQARNVPGAPGAVGQDLAEDAAGLLIEGIDDAVSPPGPEGCLGVGPTATEGGRGGLDLAAGVRQREIEREDYRYDLTTGFVLGGHCVDSRTLFYGGLIFERGSGDLLFGDGTLDHDGVGLSFGVERALSERAALSAILGHMWLDYDFTRDGGAIRGGFGATRSFLNLSGETRLEAPGAVTVLSGGLRWVVQTNEAHEDGGTPVPESRGETLSAVLGARTSFPQAMGGIAPFVEADLRRDLSRSDDLPEALDGFGADDTHARLGLGAAGRSGGTAFEAGVGANFDGDGYNGLDAHVRLTLRF